MDIPDHPVTPTPPTRVQVSIRRRLVHWLKTSTGHALDIGARDEHVALLRALAERMARELAGLPLIER